MQDTKPIRILVCAGEISGDMYAAAIIREMRAQCPAPLEFFGIGGDKMREEGVELFAHVSETGVMGFWEVAKRYRFLSNLLKTMTDLLDERRPDLLLTIDYPGFNLRLATQAHRRGIRTVHYVCPQVWAWHKKRIPKIASVLDRLLTLFPFEPALFEGTGLAVSFEGHPLADQVAATLAEPSPQLPWGEGHKIALFPGSRRSEVLRLLPDEIAAAVLLEKRIGPCSFIVPTPTPATRQAVLEILEKTPKKPARLSVSDGQSRHILHQAEAAVIKSGTSTLEGCLLLCPFVIVYRVSRLSYYLFKLLITGVKHIGLVNILADKTVCRELIQDTVTPAAIADELERLIGNAGAREKMLVEMQAVNAKVGAPGASARVASEVIKELPCPRGSAKH